MKRFFLHMFVVTILAHVLGIAVFNFAMIDWRGVDVATRMIGSLLGGVVFLFFIWFAAIPVGVLTYSLCYIVWKEGGVSTAKWLVAGAIGGTGYGVLWALWAVAPRVLLGVTGTIVGAFTGWLLARIWKMEVET